MHGWFNYLTWRIFLQLQIKKGSKNLCQRCARLENILGVCLVNQLQAQWKQSSNRWHHPVQTGWNQKEWTKVQLHAVWKKEETERTAWGREKERVSRGMIGRRLSSFDDICNKESAFVVNFFFSVAKPHLIRRVRHPPCALVLIYAEPEIDKGILISVNK